MKRLKSLFVLMLSIICVLSMSFTVFGAGASLSGPDTVRAGDTITLKLNISDSGKYGLEGTLSYDSSVVSLQSSTSSQNGWKLESNGNSFIMYDDAMSNPISGNSTVATFVFKVNSGVAAGTNVNISVNNILATDGSNESNLGSATYSKAVAKPLSSNANLSSLVVNGQTLDVKSGSYNIGEVDFSVSKLDISYKTEDGTAKGSISGNDLAVGGNTVTITVKAENGTTKSYKITVARKQDPNYVKSSDASLSGITLSRGELSPAFSKDVTNYIAYLPYEAIGSTLNISGTAADAKALEVKNADIVLAEGVNEAKVVCVAEDGTTKEYTVTVVVMPEYKGTVPEISGVDEPTTEAPEEETTIIEETTAEATTKAKLEKDKGGNGNALGILVIIIITITCICMGVYIAYITHKLKQIAKEEAEDDYIICERNTEVTEDLEDVEDTDETEDCEE